MNPTPEDVSRLKSAVTGHPVEPSESRFRAFGWDVSTRGFIATLVVMALCYRFVRAPEENMDAFREIAMMVMVFYFARNPR